MAETAKRLAVKPGYNITHGAGLVLPCPTGILEPVIALQLTRCVIGPRPSLISDDLLDSHSAVTPRCSWTLQGLSLSLCVNLTLQHQIA